MSMETLRKLAKGLNASTFRSMTDWEEEDLECATWAETVEEEQKGWIFFDDSDTSGNTKFIGRRFVIKQSDKTRVIDDCSCCGLELDGGAA